MAINIQNFGDVGLPQTTNKIQTPTPTTKSNNGVDPSILNLARAVAMQEHGGKFNYEAVNPDSGGISVGQYQWHGTDEKSARAHFQSDATAVGLNPNDFSPENQDKVVYGQFKRLKDQGRTPDEIAAYWNGKHIVNGKYVANNPAYVQGVNKYYNKLSVTNPVKTSPTSALADTTPSPDNQVINDYPGKGIVDFAHGLVEPELKGLASAYRSVQATPQVFGAVKNALSGQDFSADVQAGNQTLEKPLLGQNTGAGSSVDENLASAGNATLQGLALAAGGARPTGVFSPSGLMSKIPAPIKTAANLLNKHKVTAGLLYGLLTKPKETIGLIPKLISWASKNLGE